MHILKGQQKQKSKLQPANEISWCQHARMMRKIAQVLTLQICAGAVHQTQYNNVLRSN